ncbi:MAG: hypothetical protein ACYS76_15860 [Planctomycetota bacterium]
MCKKMSYIMAFVLTLSLVSSAFADWVVLTSDDFEAGWGSYTDGGGDCRRSSSDAAYAHQGTYCARIRDNSGTSSSFYYTNGVDVDGPGYTQIKVDFWFYVAPGKPWQPMPAAPTS